MGGRRIPGFVTFRFLLSVGLRLGGLVLAKQKGKFRLWIRKEAFVGACSSKIRDLKRRPTLKERTTLDNHSPP